MQKGLWEIGKFTQKSMKTSVYEIPWIYMPKKNNGYCSTIVYQDNNLATLYSIAKTLYEILQYCKLQ